MSDRDEIQCPGCGRGFEPFELQRYYDRNRIYSGRACSDACARVLPGQGDMWDYDAEEDLEPDPGYEVGDVVPGETGA